jgi:SNF2 family DNA or RNA helicase
MASTYAQRNGIINIDIVYKNSLTENSPVTENADEFLKVPLRLHQQKVVSAMEMKERDLTEGLDISGEKFYSRFGILGDSVGVGKSLMVLGHIGRCKNDEFVKSYTTIRTSGIETTNESLKTFSVQKRTHSNRHEAQSLILVPHTLFRQWATYIKEQTSLTALFLDKNSLFEKEDFKTKLMKSDVVLVANTMYKKLYPYMIDNSIKWRRVFIDEADTIHIVSTTGLPKSRFYWLVSASWMNLLFGNHSFYISRTFLEQYVYSENSTYHSGVKAYFNTWLASNRPYFYTNFTIRSNSFLKDLINCSHILQGHTIIRCDDEFIKDSISLPELFRYSILCRIPQSYNLISGMISPHILNLLHAGDISAAMGALGVKGEDSTTLVQAVTQNRKKELDRLQKTFEFKSTLEYSSAAAKESALANLTDKIKEIELQISDIQKRIVDYKSDTCPICYDEPADAVLTPCCTQIFCGACILGSLQRNMSCPMCRAAVETSKLKQIMQEKQEVVVDLTPQPEKKIDALLRILKENPDGRFLIFSRYDNPFEEIENTVAELNIKVKHLKGNKDVINSTLMQFASGKIQCLLLNAHYAGAGLNITSATHVILTHAMTLEEEKQILGRAYRLGRSSPLHYYKLLHEGETVS